MNRQVSLALVALTVASLAGCEHVAIASPDQTESSRASVSGPRKSETIVESEHFYMGPDGVYLWDGKPPTGDLEPANVYLASGHAEAPSNQYGVQLGGTIRGQFYYDADQGKIELVYSAREASGTAVFSNSKTGHDWEYCDQLHIVRCHAFVDSHIKQLGLTAYKCGVSVEVGGTGWARKALPFGLSLIGGVVKKIISVVPETWGERDIPIPADTDPGYTCPESMIPSGPASGGGGGSGGTPVGDLGAAPDWNATALQPPPLDPSLSTDRCTYSWIRNADGTAVAGSYTVYCP